MLHHFPAHGKVHLRISCHNDVLEKWCYKIIQVWYFNLKNLNCWVYYSIPYSVLDNIVNTSIKYHKTFKNLSFLMNMSNCQKWDLASPKAVVQAERVGEAIETAACNQNEETLTVILPTPIEIQTFNIRKFLERKKAPGTPRVVPKRKMACNDSNTFHKRGKRQR